jgi:hypothetical protein
MTKSELKTVKAMVQSPIKIQGEQNLLEKIYTEKIYSKASHPSKEKNPERI